MIKLNYASMFSSAGIGSMYLNKIDFNLVVASELINKRADLHEFFYPYATLVRGDIQNDDNFRSFVNICIRKSVNFILATPPCQGFSLAGKNKSNDQMLHDKRNYLIFDVIKVIKEVKPDYVLIENVPRFIKMGFPYKNSMVNVVDIIRDVLSMDYITEAKVLNSKFFGVPQSRKRSFIKIFKKNLRWPWPEENSKTISLREAIGFLPSIESGQISKYKYHYGRNHSDEHIEWMRHTPTGKSAFENNLHFPKKNNGERLKGYPATYMRMDWDKPAPTITMRNDAISSQSNVHPGRVKSDGTYSDARVLSILELIILTGLPQNLELPEWASEILIRQVIGESVPPNLILKIMENIL